LGELGELVPPEAHELDSIPDEHEREDEHAQVRDNAQQRGRLRPEVRPDVDFEMGTLADPDHRAEHDHPDEQEPAQLLGPDPRRDQRGVARNDLQRHRDDQDRNRPHHQPRQQPMVQLDKTLHLIALIFARICSAPISFAYAAMTGSTSFFISSRPANGTRLSLPSFSILTSFASSSPDSTWRP